MGAFGDFGEKFARLKANFVGLKRSIEYIEDFLNVQGEKIWREELTRIVEHAVEKEAMRLVNKRFQANIDSNETDYVPDFEPVDEYNATFMGRLLRQIISSMSKGYYLDSMSSWYNNSGQQMWGLRFINFLQETLGTTLLQGLDKLIVYNLMKNLRAFYFDYNIYMGQIKLSKAEMEQFNPKLKDLPPYMDSLKQFEKNLNGNYESLSDNHTVFY
jgi:WASH complex subunit strumpellin